tara:strand:+ start:134 stop:574 length:441 start_codon:yes stop_codon:yes gene_type:complete
MANWYLCLESNTLNIVDQFYGTYDDIGSRNQDLEFVKLDSDLNPNIINLSRDDTTHEIVVSLNTGKQEQERNDNITCSENQIRRKRDSELLRTDWIVSVTDSPMTQEKIEEWKVYRQALRDLPSTQSITLDENNIPNEIVWPTPPT